MLTREGRIARRTQNCRGITIETESGPDHDCQGRTADLPRYDERLLFYVEANEKLETEGKTGQVMPKHRGRTRFGSCQKELRPAAPSFAYLAFFGPSLRGQDLA